MFRKYELEYNPKIDFKMLYSINPYLKLDEDFMEIKNYFRHGRDVKSKQGKMFKNIKAVFDFLKSFPFQELTELDIKKIFNRLAIQNIEEDKIHSLLLLFKSQDSDDIPVFATKVFTFIVKNEIFNEISLELGLLIMNVVLYQNHYIPMIIFKNNFNYFKDLIFSNVTTESLVDIFSNLQDVSMRYISKFEQSTKQEIIDVLIQYRQEMNQRFQVEKLWLYGSFVRDDATSYSDVDLFVQIKDESRKKELKEYLAKVLKRSVDIQVEGNYHPRFAMSPALNERELIFDVS